MTPHLKLSWYALALIATMLVPPLLCQSVWPLVPWDTWEELSEEVYAGLLRWQGLVKLSPSRIAVIEIDQRTTEALGWPLDRQHYVTALAKLKASGHPWVLSLLRLQALSPGTLEPRLKAARAAADHALAVAIKDYGRYIGTGLVIKPGSELEAKQEELLMPRITLSRSGAAPTDLPRLPLQLAEDVRFVEGQTTFGYGTHFGLEPMVLCMQMYLTDQQQRGEFVVLSSLVWAAAFANRLKIVTATGAGWPRRNETPPFPLPGAMRVAYKECMAHPAILTNTYMERRHIERLSLLDLLTSAKVPDLRGKVVVLAGSEMKGYRGPGKARHGKLHPGDDGIVEESALAARLLDGLVAGTTVHREPLRINPWMAALPLALGLVLLILAQLVPPGWTVALPLITLVLLLGFSGIRLGAGDYQIPIQAMVSMLWSFTGTAVLYAFLRYHSIRRQVRFSGQLRQALSGCNNLLELESLARQVCTAEIDGCELAFGDFDRELYAASTDPAAALRLLDLQDHAPPPATLLPVATMLTQNIRRTGRKLLPFAAHRVRLALPILADQGKLGMLNIGLSTYSHDTESMTHLLDILVFETSQHWRRIKRLVDQKILDYRILREKTRGEIMGRFLSKVIVAKFSDDRTMEENLRTVLTPRPTKAALLQADIRGYSKVSATMSPEEMVRLLQTYFRNVVDAAQKIAQVKLIGDCIFLFIEEEAARPGVSTADLALELAATLVRETQTQNRKRSEAAAEHLNFGIAIHYGDVVVGNLSSDSCIDYTVIGPQVNLVARMEELTKNAQIQEMIGKNGVLISPQAAAALLRYRHLELIEIVLDRYAVKVRSFDEVVVVAGITAAGVAHVGL